MNFFIGHVFHPFIIISYLFFNQPLVILFLEPFIFPVILTFANIF